MEDPIAKNLFSDFVDDSQKDITGKGINDDIVANSVCVSKDESQKANDAPKEKEPMKVYLRIRPFNKKELALGEDQDCMITLNEESIELRAPKDSNAFKSAVKGLSEQTLTFGFSNVFSDNTTQKKLFNHAILPLVRDVVDGKNAMMFSYGVTSSGKVRLS